MLTFNLTYLQGNVKNKRETCRLFKIMGKGKKNFVFSNIRNPKYDKKAGACKIEIKSVNVWVKSLTSDFD